MSDDRDNLAGARRVLSPRGVTWLGMGVNALLAAAKIAAGTLFVSQSIFADGLHSASDLVTDVAVLAALGISARPADRGHPYGHRRVATLVALYIGVALLGAACWVGYSGISALHGRPTGVRGMVPLVLALVSVAVKEALFRVTRRVARRSHNAALEANAWHHRTDAFSSIAAAAGLAAVALGGAAWAFMDPLTGLVLAAFLAVAAARIITRSAAELVDSAPPAETLAAIERRVAQTPGVRSHHAFRARHVGGKIVMDIHVQVDPDLTVRQGHDIAGAVKREVMQGDPRVVEAVVHVEPAEEDPQDDHTPERGD